MKNKEGNNKKQWVLGTLLVLILLIIGAYFLIRNLSDREPSDPTTPSPFELETIEPTEPSREASLETLGNEKPPESTSTPDPTAEPTFEFETPAAPTVNTDEPTAGLETPPVPASSTTRPQTDPPETPGQTDPPETPEQTDPPETTAGRTTQAPTTKAPATSAPTTVAPTTTQAPTTAAPTTTAEPYVVENRSYSDRDHVAAYIQAFGHLPPNYITKSQADNMSGWQKNGYYVGGDRFGNYEGILPKKSGRKYYECDISYSQSNINKGNRGTKRIVYSNDGLIFYTSDHYESFQQYVNGQWRSYP